MKKFSFGSFRVRLILLTLLAVIPALGLTLYSGLEQRHHALRNAQDDALKMAENASVVQERLIENSRQIFFALSQLPDIQNLNLEACSKILKDLQAQSKGYTAFFAAKPNGDLFASALPVSGRMTFTDRPWFQQVIRTREFVIGEYLIGRITGKATVTLAYPILDRKGRLKIILGTGLDLGWVNQFMASTKTPKGTTLNVIDRKGTILLRYPEPEKFIGKTMPEGSILKAILAKGEGTSEAIGVDGVPRLYGFTSLDRFSGSVYVSVGIPKEVAFAEAMRDMKRNLIWVGIVATLAILAAWFGSSLFIMRPVDRLLRATKRLGEGDLMSRVGPRYDRGEIGQLAFAFDQMANTLAEKEAQIREHTEELERKVRERTRALQESEERFRIAAQNASDLIWDWDILNGRLEWFGRIDEILGYEPGEFPRTIEAWEKIIHPEDHDRVMDTLDRHLKKQSPYDEEYRVRRKDGTFCYWTDRGIALWDVKENPYKMIGVCTDITKRKRAEEELRESEEQYRKLFENAMDGIALADAKTGILMDCNEAIERLVGREKKELIGYSQKILHPPEDSIGEVSQTFTQHRSDKEGHLLETQVITKKGERKQVEIKANIFELKGVKVLQGIFRDITERKRVDEALLRSEKAAKQLAQENAIVAEIGKTISSTLNIEEVYERFAEEVRKLIPFDRISVNVINPDCTSITIAYAFGIKVGDIKEGDVLPLDDRFNENIVSRRKSVLFQPEDESEWAKNYPCLVPHFQAGIRSMMTVPLISKDQVIGLLHFQSLKPNSYKELDLRLAEKVGNQIAGAIANAQLFAEYKQMQKELKKSEVRFKELYHHAPVGYHEFSFSTGGRITQVNRTELEMLGYSEEEILGRYPWDFIVEQVSLELVKASLESNLLPGRTIERTFRRKDGTTFAALIQERFLRDEEGQIIGIRAAIQDITKRKLAEDQMNNYKEQLRQSQKMEALGRLAGGIAHDFNNLLTIIKGYSQLSLLKLKEDGPLRQATEEIRKAADQATDLIRQVLAFSRRQILEMKILDLNTVLKNLDKMLHRVLGEDIELVTFLADDLGRVKTDLGWIEQIIMNLVVNSRDAMPSGGRLTIETTNVELDESYARRHAAVKPGRYVMLSVSDTGVGMIPEVRDRIFEPFFTTKGSGKGTGLGLSTVYGIVKQSGGNIWVYSEPGQGTTFKIYLPRVDEPLEELREKETEEGLPRGNETILMVEDHDDVRKLAAQILEGQGYRILEASCGDDGLVISKEWKEPIHMILADVVMPRMSGRELVERCKEIRQDFKVLYMSGYTNNAIVHHGVLDQGTNLIQKPFTVEGLAKKVREVLDKA